MGVKVAVVGAGNMAREHIRAFSSLDAVSVEGIYSRTKDKASALADEFSIGNVAESIAELYEVAQPDILVITVNTQAILEIALAALDYSWTILVEKPAGANLDEARRLLAAAESRDANLYVALNRRFLSSTEAVLSGVGDDKRFIHVQDQQSMQAALSYGHPASVVDNWMYANSIHLIDYLSLFGRGEITDVINLHEWKGLETSLMLSHIRFSSGDEGLYEGIWQGPGPWAVTVTNAQQRWEMRPLETASLQEAGSRQISTLDVSAADKNFKPGFVRQAQEIVKAHTGAASAAVTLEESVKSMSLVSQIFRTE